MILRAQPHFTNFCIVVFGPCRRRSIVGPDKVVIDKSSDLVPFYYVERGMSIAVQEVTVAMAKK